MNRLDKTMRQLNKSGKKACIPFFTAGYPDIKSVPLIFKSLEKAGADIVELGMPFSDPLADGPTIQESSHQAILNGATPGSVFESVVSIRNISELPVIIFTYANIVLRYGPEQFMKRLAETGGDGLLIPDLPVEESAGIRKYAREYGIKMIFLVSPLTPPERMKLISKISDSFMYCVAVAGVTGARNHALESIAPYLQIVRKNVTKPFVVGFGVSTPEDAKSLAELSDGIVVGSGLIKVIRENRDRPDLENYIFNYASSLFNSVKSI